MIGQIRIRGLARLVIYNKVLFLDWPNKNTGERLAKYDYGGECSIRKVGMLSASGLMQIFETAITGGGGTRIKRG